MQHRAEHGCVERPPRDGAEQPRVRRPDEPQRLADRLAEEPCAGSDAGDAGARRTKSQDERHSDRKRRDGGRHRGERRRSRALAREQRA